MRTVALAAVAMVALVPDVAAPAERTLRFKGRFVVDEKLGIAVDPSEDRKAIVVLSEAHRYSLILPYAENWEFFREKPALLRGHSGLVNLTVVAFEIDETPEAYLAKRKRHLETTGAGKGITRMEIVSFKGRPVLRNEVDAGAFAPELRGAKVVHYFGAKAAKGVLYELHLSVVVDPRKREEFDDRAWLQYVALGFNALASE